MTTIEAILSSALFSTLAPFAGVEVESNYGKRFTALIEDFETLPEPGQEIAMAKTPVYKLISGPALCVDDPRIITTFTETKSLKVYKVLKFEAKNDPIKWSWICQAEFL